MTQYDIGSKTSLAIQFSYNLGNTSKGNPHNSKNRYCNLIG